MFTPPDAQARLVSELARSAYAGPHQLEELRQRIASPHHLRLFFGELVDPAWLTPMYEAGIVRFPRPDQMWPVTAMTDGLGRTSPNAVAELLLRLLADAHPGDELLAITYFEALRMAAHLGDAGHPVVAEVVRRYSESRAVRSVGVRVALDADPAAPIVVKVTRAVLRPDERLNREWGMVEILGHLVTGLAQDNAQEWVRLLAGKLRVAAEQPLARFTTDIEPFPTWCGAGWPGYGVASLR
jgi:hypothetical protein